MLMLFNYAINSKISKTFFQLGPQLMSPLRSSKLMWPHPAELKSTSLTRARWPTKAPTSQVLRVIVSVHLPVSLWTTWKKKNRENGWVNQLQISVFEHLRYALWCLLGNYSLEQAPLNRCQHYRHLTNATKRKPTNGLLTDRLNFG